MPVRQQPILVNRGAAGLLKRLPAEQKAKDDYAALLPDGVAHAVDKISDDLADLAIDIDTLVHDPNNAREHNERNLQAIRVSLCVNGQYQVLVARRSDSVVAVGNGRLQAMRQLGWTKAAVLFRDMTDAEFACLAVADNRSAELASWNVKTLAILDRLTQSAGLPTVGWSMDELEVLRKADFWTPPAIDDDSSFSGSKDGAKERTVEFTEGEWGIVQEVVGQLREVTQEPEKDVASCLTVICEMWKKWYGWEPSEGGRGASKCP